MNCNVPTDICFSFSGFQARGGKTDVHKDGWGIAFFEGKGARLFLDPLPSAHSPVAELVRNYPIKSKNVVAHIRKATQGIVNLENTHPFVRELWGHQWIFAHNGHLPNYQPRLNGRFLPVGCTDSEMAFCWLMQEVAAKFTTPPPSPEDLFFVLAELTRQLGAVGEFNFLLANGETLFAHSSTQLTYIVRKAPFTSASLKDQEMSVDFSEVTTPQDRVAVIATQPLTENESWITMDPGTLWCFREGLVAHTAKTVVGVKHPLCR